MHLLNRGVHCENQRFFLHCTENKMDYRQKMVVSSHHKYKQEDDDDEDLEALRLAALQTLRAKDSLQNKRQYSPLQRTTAPQITQPSQAHYKGQKVPIRGFYQKTYAPIQKQNGTCYYPSPCNPNLITIVPVDANIVAKETELSSLSKLQDANSGEEKKSFEESKFYRYKDNASGSEEEDLGDHKNDLSEKVLTESIGMDGADADEESTDKENQSAAEESPPRTEEDDDDEDNDDDDDVLLMADLEEEDSLERLMDEMEKEMNVDKPSEKREKRRESLRKDMKKEPRRREESLKSQNQKTKSEQTGRRNKSNSPAQLLPATVIKNEQRSVSPHTASRPIHKRRSLSPRSRSRKKSPRRSPRRSPVRQIRKLQRELPRYRSPRKSPARFSPRPRSPRLSPRLRSPRSSPRRSPNRSPKRSPLRKLSPRGRSPRASSHVRSPRSLRSRSPRLSSRSRSPRPIRSPRMSPRPRSPRLPRSRSPRLSPRRSPTRHSSRSRSPKLSPQLKSPRLSPRRLSPARRPSPRSRTPRLSPRRGSPRFRSPKRSPRRSPPRIRSPRPSPHESPWSSPRNSPRLSPRRRRSPKWSPKESSRKPRARSITPDGPTNPPPKRDVSPVPKGKSPDNTRTKLKQREDVPDKPTVVVTDSNKESQNVVNDPILEARRRKFESTKPIDPVHANKKIKLTKKDSTSKKPEPPEEPTQETTSVAIKKAPNSPVEYDAAESDLCLDVDYEFEDLPESMDETSVVTVASSVTVCEEPEPVKIEKEKPSKKKKKRDKELYQVGKLKNELPLSERIGKEKKCKKHKDVDGPNEEVETIIEDLTVDEEGDLRAELSRRRAERLNRTAPIQSARLVQSAFKGVVSEAAKTNAKVNRRHIVKTDDKSNQKEVRRVTVLHRPVSELHDSEDETVDSKVPIRFRLGISKPVQDTREAKASRKASKRQSRKVKHKNLSLNDTEHTV
ncbi:serine/arginine repetitive matrix protein 1 isoform X3 [Cephus cinctus]|uniref:Serine/arginine repetitive matrix protein 1 isoform X3 n=1 Tax=Cephus cinctus TaxID=211228 RepID=A0AAJ7BMM0_CEPCN|nr:serine/arginine repetitive matrix protein 1 isoform X3 [Cephus cinctus]